MIDVLKRLSAEHKAEQERKQAEREARRKLEAAAPDLLAACEYALDAVEDSELYPQDATDKLVAAIKKAK